MTQAQKMEAFNKFAKNIMKSHSKEELEKFFNVEFRKTKNGYDVYHEGTIVFENLNDWNSTHLGMQFGHALLSKMSKA